MNNSGCCNFGNSGNSGNFGDSSGFQMGGSQFLPNRVFPTQYNSPQVMPTEHYVQNNIINHVVPHVQPTHLTTVNRHNIHHQYHFPHTESTVNECHETHTMCGERWNPWHGRNCGCR